MFTIKQLQRYADVLWWGLTTARTSPFQKNDIVVIRYNKPAVELAEILYGFMANTLYDENFGGPYGNCHIALGASYSNTYTGDSRKLNPDRKRKLGFNESALHWDLVNTEKKRVTAHLKSGEARVIYENGRFKY